jgi:hypothetical protein
LVGTINRKRRISRRLVAGLLFLLTAGAHAADTATLDFDPERVIRGERFTLQIRTSIPWGEEVEIIRPELIGPMVWWAYPYARPWTVETDEGTSVRLIEVLGAIRIDQPGFHMIDPFRIRAGEREAVTAPREIIGLEPDEADFPYPVTTAWRQMPEKVWQGQSIPVVLEARSLVSLALADSAVLNSAPEGLLDEAPGLGGIVTRPHGNDILYDVPMASWIWTIGEPGKHTFPGVRISVAGLSRSTPSFPVEVQALPESLRSSGAVGYFDFGAEWDEGPYRVGDIVSVRFRVEGKGNINVLEIPTPGLEGASLVSRGSTSSYVPGPQGYEGWREERFDFQIEEIGDHQLDIPAWTWMEPEGTGRIRTKTSGTGVINATASVEDVKKSNADSLLGADIFRYKKANFHWKNQYWYLLALPGFIALITLFLIRRPGVRGLAAMAVLPLLLSASNIAVKDAETAARAAEFATEGNWETARGLYGNLLAEKGESPGLLHDLAIIEMEADNTDTSVAYMRRALFLRPGSPKLSETLDWLETRFGLSDQISVPLKVAPSLVFAIWLVGMNIFFGALTLLMFRRDAREVILFVSAIILLTASSIMMAYTNKLWGSATAVVRVDSEPLRKIPGPLATDWIQLPAGSAVTVTAIEGDDSLVRTGYGLEGWLPNSSLILVSESVDGL